MVCSADTCHVSQPSDSYEEAGVANLGQYDRAFHSSLARSSLDLMVDGLRTARPAMGPEVHLRVQRGHRESDDVRILLRRVADADERRGHRGPLPRGVH